MNTLFKVLPVSYEKNGSNIQGTNARFSFFNVTMLIFITFVKLLPTETMICHDNNVACYGKVTGKHAVNCEFIVTPRVIKIDLEI